ncbi:dipeptidase PepV [Mechercharimyces sp. CAU 1602]|uniref:dipeptidase PepV n=1 Tax=Mechercharimyces sp. CAU 1602 TaxID=2973933 RepID=UPI00216177A1|nr:dipeptidase PepV [Mechercharimyces sp. CAU 1602]MCS1349997.1 dipeptidase PepV [Mechercharimyces sp. CAU 1602]
MQWLQEVEKRKDELLAKTKELLAIESVLDEETVAEGAPFGEKIAEALSYMLELAEENEFKIKNVDGYAGHAEIGSGEELVGILAHLDVVPAGEGWTSPPFSPEIRDGDLYARGAIDDKGPAMAAFFATKLLKELNLPLSKRIRLIWGTDEESLWRDMEYYFEREEMPTMGFTPDAYFPIITAEKGLIDLSLAGELTPIEEEELSAGWTLGSFISGQRPNMVPDYAEARLLGDDDVFILKEAFQTFLLENRIRGYAEEANADLTLVVEGKSHHGSEPERGQNAALELARFLHTVDLDQKGAQYINLINDCLLDSFYGEKLGVDQMDDRVGKLTINAGVFRYKRGENQQVVLNIRYPLTGDGEWIMRELEQQMAPYGVQIEQDLIDHKMPHSVDHQHPLVQTLARVYEEQTGEKAELMAIGGGTYARALDTGVAFGPLFPGRPDSAHQKDERISVEDLIRTTAIYAQAIYELAR